MQRAISVFVGIYLFCCCASTSNAQSQRLFSELENVELSDFSFYLDSANDKTIHTYSSLVPIDLMLMDTLADEIQRKSAWIRFKVFNLSNETKEIVLRVPLHDTLLFYFQYNGVDSIALSGNDIYNPSHIITGQRRTTKLFLGAGDSCIVVLHAVSSRIYNYFYGWKIVAQSEQQFLQYEGDQYFQNRWSKNAVVIFLSMMVFQLLFVSLQGIFMKREYYFFYICYIFTIGLYYLARNEAFLNLNVFFTFYPTLVNKINNFLLYIPFFFYYRFARHFCEVDAINPLLAKRIKRGEYFILLFSFTILLNDVFYWMTSIIGWVHLIGILSILLMSVYLLYYVYQLKNIVAKILVAGSIVALFSSVFANLLTYIPAMMSVFPIAPLTLTMVGVVIEMIIFNAGLVVKARQTELDQVQAQRKLLLETEEKRNIERAYFEERNRIAADLHDDIGATLSSIGIYSDSAAKKLALGDIDKSKSLLTQIAIISRETMNNMSDIVWTINPLNDDKTHLTEKMESYVVPVLQSKGIKLNLKMDVMSEANEIPLSFRKNIYLIFKEAINNLVKYSEATQVNVFFSEREDEWSLIVSDNGRGMSSDMIKPGNGLRNMTSRAMELNGKLEIKSDNSGTSIILNIPK